MLFTGDHILPRITPNISAGLADSADIRAVNALGDYLRSLGEMTTYDKVEALPAHEYRFRGLAYRVDALHAHHAERLDEILDVLRHNPGSTTLEVAAQLTWSRPWEQNLGQVRQAAVGETYAHLLHLRVDGAAENKGIDVDAWFVR